jgi:hypothetical protein
VLRSGRRYPINIASIIPRPPSPYPVSARSTSPASLGSSNGSNYFSPPAEADGETPPYKPDADDPISLNMYKCRKRKRRASTGTPIAVQLRRPRNRHRFHCMASVSPKLVLLTCLPRRVYIGRAKRATPNKCAIAMQAVKDGLRTVAAIKQYFGLST